jgi:pimeloyl-ACP methyl ester carboxylesterase
VILIGHSMGGPVALLAAKRLPGTVIAVIGADTLQNADNEMPPAARKQFMDAFEKDFKGTMHAGLTGLVNEKADAELKNWLVTRAEAQDPKMAMGLMRDMNELSTKTLLQGAKVPVRCINSSGGYRYFRPTAEGINKKYADYKAVTIADVGHYPMLEKPDEFNQKMHDVLKEFATSR